MTTTQVDWWSAGQRWLTQQAAKMADAQRRAWVKAGRSTKTFRYNPPEWHREAVTLLGRNDEEGFKALKLNQLGSQGLPPLQKARHHSTKKTKAQLDADIAAVLAKRGGASARGRAHSTMKTDGPLVLARWESRSGKHWVELTQHDSVTIANAMDPSSVGGRAFTWYGYTSPGSSGSLSATTSADAVAEMERRVKRGDFLPDAAKTAMTRVR